MNLDEAIEHALEKAEELMKNQNTCECGKEHLQLAEWLKELEVLREHFYKLNYNFKLK